MSVPVCPKQRGCTTNVLSCTVQPGVLIISDWVVVHPLLSVTVKVYIPGAKFVIVRFWDIDVKPFGPVQ